MERCDFASVIAVIRADLLEDSLGNQTDFVEDLFGPYLAETETVLDMGLVSKWLNGLAKPSPAIGSFYQKRSHRKDLEITFLDVILPNLSDSAMVVQNVYALLLGDVSISESKKAELCEKYPCETKEQEAAFLADVLLFGLTRPFVKRNIRKPQLPPAGSLSPILADYIIDDGLPKPCPYFCGRGRELTELHTALIKHDKIFLNGIPGIGKSEIAKAYAKEHRKEYTNILYIPYTGDLRADIVSLIFADDLPEEDMETRFRKHNRYLRTLREDTLLIIDNFNTTIASDDLLDVVLKYRCRILFTTRNSFPGKNCITVTEIEDEEVLFQLVTRFFSKAEKQRETVLQIIETVHRHTFAVELAARLLETGILKPRKVLDKLKAERADFDAEDKIHVSKDGSSRRATYYDHIHTLFAMFRLSKKQQDILRNLTLTPVKGIPARLFGRWMDFSNLNSVNDLIELGFIEARPGHRISLHLMMREVAQSEFPPSISACHTMLESIRFQCQLHGIDPAYYKLMHQTVVNTVLEAKKDDTAFYLRFLEDTFESFDKYHDEDGVNLLLGELDALLSDPLVGNAVDRAILIESHAFCEKDDQKAIRMMLDALELLPEVNESNALAVSNLHANIGDLYRRIHQNELAREHLETAMTILEDYGLFGSHDSLMQVVSYANYLDAIGEKEAAVAALKKVEPVIRRINPDSLDHAKILESLGYCLLPKEETVGDGRAYLMQAMEIYETVWADEPQLIEEKRRLCQQAHINAGIEIGKEIIKKRHGKT